MGKIHGTNTAPIRPKNTSRIDQLQGETLRVVHGYCGPKTHNINTACYLESLGQYSSFSAAIGAVYSGFSAAFGKKKYGSVQQRL